VSWVGPADGLALTTARGRAVYVARCLIGTPYLWAGNTMHDGGIDCSGFVQYVWKCAGVEPFVRDFPDRIDLTAQTLYEALDPVTSEEHVLPGDCLFLHAAGQSKRIVHVVMVTGIGGVGEDVAPVELIGASKGYRGLDSVDKARAIGAKIKLFNSVDYFPNHAGYRRMPSITSVAA
jgi:hypothetical protein